ncbi:MAG: VPGUxxT family thioredoxin-like (seleno)protein, type 2 [Phycisphaerales bacterium]
MHRITCAALIASCVAGGVCAAGPASSQSRPMSGPPATENPVELGTVRWTRGLEAACDEAKRRQRPVFILFSEVPGCFTCKNYGERVMSHPLIVEAIESLFVPLAVYNNIEGDDRKALEQFGEPTWNNPVVRIVSSDRKPLADRVSDEYTTEGVSRAMTQSLGAVKTPVPRYLALLADEGLAKSSRTGKAVFAVHCFWEGDQNIGALDGVVGTRIGFLDGQEVVEVEYAPAKLPFARLREQVAGMSCATRIYARDDEQASSKSTSPSDTLSIKKSSEPIRLDAVQKYHLSHTVYKHVPMTEPQACRVNAALAKGEDPDVYLSPRQVEIARDVRKRPELPWPSAVGEEIAPAWKRLDRFRAEHPESEK